MTTQVCNEEFSLGMPGISALSDLEKEIDRALARREERIAESQTNTPALSEEIQNLGRLVLSLIFAKEDPYKEVIDPLLITPHFFQIFKALSEDGIARHYKRTSGDCYAIYKEKLQLKPSTRIDLDSYLLSWLYSHHSLDFSHASLFNELEISLNHFVDLGIIYRFQNGRWPKYRIKRTVAAHYHQVIDQIEENDPTRLYVLTQNLRREFIDWTIGQYFEYYCKAKNCAQESIASIIINKYCLFAVCFQNTNPDYSKVFNSSLIPPKLMLARPEPSIETKTSETQAQHWSKPKYPEIGKFEMLVLSKTWMVLPEMSSAEYCKINYEHLSDLLDLDEQEIIKLVKRLVRKEILDFDGMEGFAKGLSTVKYQDSQTVLSEGVEISTGKVYNLNFLKLSLDFKSVFLVEESKTSEEAEEEAEEDTETVEIRIGSGLSNELVAPTWQDLEMISQEDTIFIEVEEEVVQEPQPQKPETQVSLRASVLGILSDMMRERSRELKGLQEIDKKDLSSDQKDRMRLIQEVKDIIAYFRPIVRKSKDCLVSDALSSREMIEQLIEAERNFINLDIKTKKAKIKELELKSTKKAYRDIDNIDDHLADLELDLETIEKMKMLL